MLIRANILPARQHLSYICACVCVGVQGNRRILSWWANYAVHIFMSNYGSSRTQNWLIVLPRLPMRFLFLPNGNSDWSLNLFWVSLEWLWLLHGQREGGIQVSAGMQIAVGVCGWHDSQFSLEKIRELLRYEIQINFLALSPPPPPLWVIKPLRSLWSTKIVENFLALGYLHTHAHTHIRTHSIWP